MAEKQVEEAKTKEAKKKKRKAKPKKEAASTEPQLSFAEFLKLKVQQETMTRDQQTREQRIQ